MPALVREISAGIAYDLGAGEGRNAIYLARNGWKVFAVDSDRTAIERLKRSALREGLQDRISITQGDANEFLRRSILPVDLVLLYGLPHCLSGRSFGKLIEWCACVKPGAIVAGSALTAEAGMPSNHMTGRLYLRKAAVYRRQFSRFKELLWQEGEIHESHEPLVGKHVHSAIWFVCRRERNE